LTKIEGAASFRACGKGTNFRFDTAVLQNADSNLRERICPMMAEELVMELRLQDRLRHGANKPINT